MLGLMGKKIGMTQIFHGDDVMPVTVVEVTGNYVLQKKTDEKEGYTALQIGTKESSEKNVTKPMMGIFNKAGVKPQKFIKEFTVDSVEGYELGQDLGFDCLNGIKYIDVTGTSKGKGFQGVMKRHNFSGNRKTHGVSRAHRSPGSIGQSSQPSKVIKGMKMAGRMGGEQVTVQNLELVKIDLENKILLIKGAVPGPKNGMVVVKPAVKK